MGKEKLPVGVGRVPSWWMELTPHYTLDLEEDENRRLQEEQEALYYMQMAMADDARVSGEWKSNWGGRSTNGSGDGSDGGVSSLFGGRNFQPGSAGWDPKEWGVEANDPDYKSYLKGAKLPQSYIDAMKSFAGQAGITYDASALHQSGKQYGSSAGKPAFTPAWAKKKLRRTGQGDTIRHGIYNDSPNKHLKHRVNATAARHEQQDDGAATNTPELNAAPASPRPAAVTQAPAPVAPPAPAPAPVAPPAPAPAPAPVAPPPAPTPATVAPVPPSAPAVKKWTPPKTSPPPPHPAPAPAPVVVRSAPVVEHSYTPAPIRSNTPAPAPADDESKEKQAPKYSFNDYYYNAGAATTPVKAPTSVKAPTPEPPKPVVAPPAPQPSKPVAVPVTPPPAPEPQQPEEEEYEEEYEEVVEYVDEYDGEEGEEYEEYVEEYVEEEEEGEQEEAGAAAAVLQTSNLTDLQALLAQKQAELARLQGM